MNHRNQRTEKIPCSHCREKFTLQGDESPCPFCQTINYSSRRLRELIRDNESKATEHKITAVKLQLLLTHREHLRSSTPSIKPILYTPEDFWKNVHGVPREFQSRSKSKSGSKRSEKSNKMKRAARVSVDLSGMPG